MGKEIAEPTAKTAKPKMDLCVLCWRETKYTKNTHINFRKNYVEGCGQLCEDCAKIIEK